MNNRNNQDKVDEFAQKYDAVIEPSHRVFRRASYGKVSSVATSVSLPSDVFDNIDYGDVACVNIHMPEDRFRALVEHDEWLNRTMRSWSRFGQRNIVEQHERECRARQENPAVKKAYENYQMLLSMVENNYS